MKPAIGITEIPELAALVANALKRMGRSTEEIEIGLAVAGEMIVGGWTNPVEIVREVERQLADDLPRLMEDARRRSDSARAKAMAYKPTGAKTSGKPTLRGRWDLEEGGS